MNSEILFFVHIMKTSGTSFWRYMCQNFAREDIYPGKDEPLIAHFMLDYLRGIPLERRRTLRAYKGHFPAFAAELVRATKTVTFLREPVARAVSHLKQIQRIHHPDRSLDEIYQDDHYRLPFLVNHQTKVFSLSAADQPASFMDVIEIDQSRLDAAKDQLSRIDVVGLQENHKAAVLTVQNELRLAPPKKEWRAAVGDRSAVPEALRDRITEDNRWDIEFYAWAVRNVAIGTGAETSAAGAEARHN